MSNQQKINFLFVSIHVVSVRSRQTIQLGFSLFSPEVSSNWWVNDESTFTHLQSIFMGTCSFMFKNTKCYWQLLLLLLVAKWTLLPEVIVFPRALLFTSLGYEWTLATWRQTKRRTNRTDVLKVIVDSSCGLLFTHVRMTKEQNSNKAVTKVLSSVPCSLPFVWSFCLNLYAIWELPQPTQVFIVVCMWRLSSAN